MPAFPGATKSRSTRGDRASFHASACSRPPLTDEQNLHPGTLTSSRGRTGPPSPLLSVPEVPDSGEHHGRHRARRPRRSPPRRACCRRAARSRATPASRASSTPSGKGRTRRSRALRRSGRDSWRRALSIAIRTASTREVCPPPMPRRAVRGGEHDRVRLDVLDDAPGRSPSPASSSRGRGALARDLGRGGVLASGVGVLHEEAADHLPHARPLRAASGRRASA